ncbi:MAG: exosortase [Alphaproteobacteria bacterium]|nr:MAG: exosortase [Alphaproteobacteria bacterium]
MIASPNGRRPGLPDLAPLYAVILVWLALVLITLPTWRDLWRVWSGNVIFHHGPVVLLVAIAMILHRLRHLPGAAPVIGPLGWLPAAVVSWGWFAAWLADIDIGMHLAAILLLAGAVPAMVGWPMAWRMRFPLFYLLLAVPAGLSLIAPLQRLTADLAVGLLDLMEIAHLRDRFVIELMTPQGLARFSIEAACSGIRYLFASLAVGLLFAHVAARRPVRRMAVTAVFIIVPVLANALRAAGIVALAAAIGAARANAIDHRLYGEIFFLITLGLSFALAIPWTERRSRKDRSASPIPLPPAGSLRSLPWPAIARYLIAAALGPALALAWQGVFFPTS